MSLIVPPTEVPAPRIEPLAALPVFLNLDRRRVVIAGGGAAAAWKAELVAAAGAVVAAYVPDDADEIMAIAARFPQRFEVFERVWTAADLPGAAVAIGALDGDSARQFSQAARAAGVPVNIVDTPHLSTFNFGTIVNRNPVTVAISTDGVAPVLGQLIRARLEAMLHPVLGIWASQARLLRDGVKARHGMGAARREVWRRFAGKAIDAQRAPLPGEIEAILREAPLAGGSVALVGAGPGSADHLTLRGLRTLQTADVILHDRLVGEDVLALARREATRMLVGKAGGGRRCRQSDISDLMVRLAQDGKRVVRLKGGDPLIFGRAGEEIDACRSAGIPVEIVPGVTAAFGAAAELLMPLTDRRFAKRLQFVTGHAETGLAPEHDWPSLADPWATTVFYMGARTFRDMLPKLLAADLDAETPAVVITAATTSKSTAVRSRAADLAEHLGPRSDGEPRLIIIGRAVSAIEVPVSPSTAEAEPVV